MIDRDAETELLRRAGTGDRAAFDTLLTATAPAVWSVVRRLTVDEATAEDTLQETYMAAWRGADSFLGKGTARSWLYGLARRKAAQTWRRRSGEPRHAVPLTELALCAGWGEDPESLAGRAEDRAVLLAALSTLRDADQEVITRCDLEGLTPTELAEELGIAAGTLRVRLHRARLHLLAALKAEVTDE